MVSAPYYGHVEVRNGIGGRVQAGIFERAGVEAEAAGDIEPVKVRLASRKGPTSN